MDIDQALHYTGILISKLEQAERRAGAARIHNIRTHLAILEGYRKMLQDKQNGKPYPLSTDSILGYLNEGLESAEKFLTTRPI
jgi:hypothetical protein